MPIFIYECQTCGLRFDVEQRLTEKRGASCPLCHEKTQKRLIGGDTFKIIGDDWDKEPKYNKRI